MTPEEASALWKAMDGGPTCTLEEYQSACAVDPNFPWRIAHGHILNLLDQALEEIEALTGGENPS